MKKFFRRYVLFFAVLFVFCMTALCVSAKGYTDVKTSDWFYSDVEYMAQHGFVNGYPDGSFKPQKSISKAEFIAMLCRVCGYDSDGGSFFSDTFLDSSRKPYWFYQYISAGLDNNIIYRDDYEDAFLPGNHITRAEAAVFVYRALSLSGCAYQNPYSDTLDGYVTSLYYENIMHGTDSECGVFFYPENPLTRAQACAILRRVNEYKSDKNLYAQNYKKQFGEKEASLILAPKTRQEFCSLILYAVQNQLSELNFTYPGVGFYDEINDTVKSEFSEAFRIVSAAFPEYLSLVYAEYEKSGNGKNTDVKITFLSAWEGTSLGDIYKKQAAAENYAKYLAGKEFSKYDGDGEKLAAIHDFLVLKCSFSQEEAPAEAYTAYGALLLQNAVCQGYSAAFNLLARQCGIKSISVQNSIHAWNVALVKGKSLHYDALWDDPMTDNKADSKTVYRNYCALPEEKITKSRPWDKELYGTQLFDGVGF